MNKNKAIFNVSSRLKQILKCLVGRASVVNIVPVSFCGWKLATGTRPPWIEGGGNIVSREFSRCDLELRALVASKSIVLTQFRENAVEEEVAQMRWRHYLVYWSARFAMGNTHGDSKNFVEMGVCDGLTAWYASHAMHAARSREGSFFLYDAWEGMREDLLASSEKSAAGSYAYLNIENTQSNLRSSGYENFVFNKGFVPESFTFSKNPDSLVWLHIDLNSVLPTIASLDFFWDKLASGGVILLDDFAWPGYEETQARVERWCKRRQCLILQLPTGQALIIKTDQP